MSGVKRLFDILIGGMGLVFAAPLLLLIAVLVKLTSRGPVFYRGVRVGRNGQPFRIFKFRSMIVGAETQGPPNVSATDRRVTRIGKILRQTKLDELPQLISVFKGDMSLVGPRPELQQYVDLYTNEERDILRLRPGVTDWASIVHFDQYVDFTRGDDPDKTYLDDIRPLKVRLQLFYLQNHSLWVDFKILAYTLAKLTMRNDWLPPEIRPLVVETRAGRRRNAARRPGEPAAVEFKPNCLILCLTAMHFIEGRPTCKFRSFVL